MRKAKFKSAYSLHIIGPRGLQNKANLWVFMGRASSDVVRFGLGTILQDQVRVAQLKSANNSGA